MYTSTKLFREFPNAYRNPASTSDCFLLHGYCRDFFFTFGAKDLDKQGFVVDFGGLKKVKQWLEEKFDHTVLLQGDDPELGVFYELQDRGVLRLTTLPLVSCEGIAEFVGLFVDDYIQDKTGRRAHVVSCECRENGKNSAVWTNTPEDYRLSYNALTEYLRAQLSDNTSYRAYHESRGN